MLARRTLVAILGLLGLLSFAAPPLPAAQKMDRIIISGASGTVGQFAIKELLRRGVDPKNLILVSRSTDKLAEYVKMGATERYGDLYKPETLPAAYAGGTRMLLISIGNGPNRPLAQKQAFDAAVKAGVKHIVYTSFLGSDKGESTTTQEHQETEKYLRASGAKWTILRMGFYSDIYVPAAILMAKTGSTAVRPNEQKTGAVARADCGAASAGALLQPSMSENQIFEISGPELVDRRDVARIVGEMIGKRIEVTELNAASIDFPGGPPGPSPTSPQIVSDAVLKLTGKPPIGVKTLLEANKEQILAAAKGEAVALPQLYEKK